MIPQIKEKKLQIVLVGNFNPHIFHPQWFISQKLLGQKEGESAKIEIIHPDIAIFSLDWLRLEVTRERLVAISNYDQYNEVIKDLIIGTFSVLQHTPMKMLGINHTYISEVSDEAIWKGIGDKLAPKDIWGKFMKKPGLRSLIVESNEFENEIYKNIVRVTVDPAKGRLNLRLNINDHFELINIDENSLGSNGIISILKDEWANSEKKALCIKDKLFAELP